MALNATPSEIERLMIFTAAEFARRNRALGIRLSHPEAVALITDEVMTAARLDLPYDEIRDMAGRLLTTDDVLPGVPAMVPLIVVECAFSEGHKLLAIFDPIVPGKEPSPEEIAPGEVISPDEEITLLTEAPGLAVEVVNTGDRDVQVRSHTHFFEVNRKLRFDRQKAWGMKLDVAAGAGVRFEPGIPRVVRLVRIAGERVVFGQAGLVNGHLDAAGAKEIAIERARERGYLGV
jgi:urease subunit gamma/beta